MSVNGVKLQAFVDSGAQSTIMSVQCAERCGIMRLLDRRYAGVAKGVGSAKIHGRVHQVPCVVGTKHISMSFTILENNDMGQSIFQTVTNRQTATTERVESIQCASSDYA
jgi:DNA damage-inducible protein 1